ncbi:MAG: Elongation factor Ts [Parcubacteria group bacterium GW2011_GWF2_39_8b]|uniref:Elongation factor Ts n=3 Tax=Candidatus Zambryskiibacteriota TaxID=1817925 RepID=A0A1G2T642_9BACT|nr:MAG: Elongation factor Ts [Parcubacteria group bacterium GW2011_GWF2_39_8b]KKR45927.1 MAG: Elongation factor Ts [Parcubacteria group bacterium GW2011_GWA2_40_14]OHA92755.1 MAG: translation elongation factor Ts [Candidatus Zambryskibacteria bacterium RIFCSPHIGHO2_02_38_10.5]OHA97099.1 MAG: translation elongation factor Ts [Candidatus Zambryskibacteria bacterium RIFCSPHIGHO2_02_FULL_39_82]OHA99753.1 MAG: translation elongation factor Ts [Candidatus Zambryskibacteria bacterium RIFCSPHIGHO2_12_F
MTITTELVKKLRDETGISVMQCKKALEEVGGDMEKAKVFLQQKSAEISQKKGDRTLGAGVISSYIHATGNVGTMIELLCETDFVAKNEEFKSLARDIAMHATAMNPENEQALLVQPFIKNPEVTITNLLQLAVQKFGEKIEISRFIRYSVSQ